MWSWCRSVAIGICRQYMTQSAASGLPGDASRVERSLPILPVCLVKHVHQLIRHATQLPRGFLDNHVKLLAQRPGIHLGQIPSGSGPTMGTLTSGWCCVDVTSPRPIGRDKTVGILGCETPEAGCGASTSPRPPRCSSCGWTSKAGWNWSPRTGDRLHSGGSR
ncbi:hypothetical protein FQZ97_805380 [compost metagenome]